MASLSYIFTKFAAKILDFDNTVIPEEQFAMIQDMLASHRVQVKGKEAKELLKCLKRKHLVNSITMRSLKNGLVFSSSGNGTSESEAGTDILRFVNSNFDKTDFVTLRTDKEWIMLLPLQEKLYIVKANSALSTVELRALAKEIEASLKKSRLS